MVAAIAQTSRVNHRNHSNNSNTSNNSIRSRLLLNSRDRLHKSAIGSKLAYSASICDPLDLSAQTRFFAVLDTNNNKKDTNFKATDDEGLGGGSLVLCVADTYLGSVRAGVGSGPANNGPRAFIWSDNRQQGGASSEPSESPARPRASRARRSSLFVAFRGTVGMRDVLDSLDVRTDRYAFCGRSVRVHAGMLGAFAEMEGELTDAILGSGEFDQIPASLTFAGHSKGGSHAQFAAAYYSSMLAGRCLVSCHTFGAPRVGDDAFAEWYSESVAESVVMIDRRDPVARLPPEFAGYHGLEALSGTHLFDGEGRCPLLLGCHDMDSYLEHVVSSPLGKVS
jgi:hypothetical protein